MSDITRPPNQIASMIQQDMATIESASCEAARLMLRQADMSEARYDVEKQLLVVRMDNAQASLAENIQDLRVAAATYMRGFNTLLDL